MRTSVCCFWGNSQKGGYKMAAKNAKDDGKFEDKQKALDAALSQIEKQFGKGAVMKLGDNNAQMQVEVVPSGSLSLDLALGIGGGAAGSQAQNQDQDQQQGNQLFHFFSSIK